MASKNAVNSGIAVQPNQRAIIPALWQQKLIAVSSFKSQVVFDLFKYGMSNEVLKRLWVRVKGTLNTGSATAGTATGLLNPFDLLTSSTFVLAPVPGAGLLPFNQPSGRSLYLLEAIQRRNFASQNFTTAITDGGGAETVDWRYNFNFRRNFAKKGIEYDLPLAKFTSAVLTLNFGGQTTLFTGGSNTWDFSGLNVELWGDYGYDVDPAGVHATEVYEQVFPITANGDLLINQLPAGVLYTDFAFLAEKNNVPTNGIVNNIDIEGAGRNWTMPGDNNASILNEIVTTEQFDGSAASSGFGGASTLGGVAGLYLFPMRDGSYLRSFDARNTQLLIKVNITGWENSHTYNLRMIARKLTPYGIIAHNPANAGTTVASGKR
jgi:hypothetical protein